jgi:hypothetical protein
VIDVRSIREEHIGNRAPVLVLAECLKGNFFPEGEVRGGVLGFLAVGLAFLLAVDAVESNKLRPLVVQDFDSIAVEDGDDGAGEICRDSGAGKQKVEECSPDGEYGATCYQASWTITRSRYQLFFCWMWIR